ncbi:hypothetical protein [Paenibacillus flagellatus]|uniref:hypothetical protein n=1 Tax=Paenibacillus flagellatus TaxID=2211139 RepID=UPI00268E5106
MAKKDFAPVVENKYRKRLPTILHTEDEVTSLTDTGSIALFTILAFSLALILIMKKDTIPPQMRRMLALVAVVLVSCAFFLIVFSLIGTG